MNERSIEYGLIINDYGKVNFYNDLAAVADRVEDEIAYFEDLPVEGEEHSYFISFGDLEHGKGFPLMPNGAKAIKRRLQTLIKPCGVTWGVIETWR